MMMSEVLGRSVRLRVSMNGLRSVEHVGGLDNWLIKTKAEKLEGEVTAMTAVLEATVKERRKLLPAEFHELLDALPLLKRLEWLTKNADKLQQGGVPGTQKIGSNGMTKEQKADQEAAYAQYYGRI